MKAEIIRNALDDCNNCEHFEKVLCGECSSCVNPDGDITNFKLRQDIEEQISELEQLSEIGRMAKDWHAKDTKAVIFTEYLEGGGSIQRPLHSMIKEREQSE